MTPAAIRAPLACALLALAASPVLAQPEDVRVDLVGEVRVRSELDDRTPEAGADHATLLRTRLGAEIALGSEAGGFVQLSDSRVFGEEESTLTDASADRLDLHQAYLDWRPVENARVRAGRQELAFADERLVGPVGWANVTRAFDGVRATLEAGDWTVDGFAAVLDEGAAVLAIGLDPRRNESEDDDRSVFGAWASSPYVDLFVIGDRNAVEGDRTDIDRVTVGGYLRGSRGPLRGRLTAAWQTGEQTSAGSDRQDVEAYLVSGRVDAELGGPIRPSVGAQLDVVSGDDDPADDTFGAFSTLYATNHAFYGFMDFFLDVSGQTGGRGLVDLIARGSVRAGEWRLAADLHRLWLQEERADGERTIGTELDVTAGRTVVEGFAVQAGYSVFDPADGAAGAPVVLGDDTLQWAYLMATLRFRARLQ